jgi:hypothetical protein
MVSFLGKLRDPQGPNIGEQSIERLNQREREQETSTHVEPLLLSLQVVRLWCRWHLVRLHIIGRRACHG